MKILLITTVLIAASFAFAQDWQEVVVDGFTLNWATMPGDLLSVKLSAPATGWLSVGFDPTQMMLNANIIIGYVESSNTVLRDDFGWQMTSHKADTTLGGTHDLTVDGGSEAGGTTEIRFTIPMNSGDSYDRELVPGNTYTVIFARRANGEDKFTAPHEVRSSSQIEIAALALEPYSWAAVKGEDW